MLGTLQQYQNSKTCVQVKILRFMYLIALIFAEETDLSKKPNVSRGSN